MAIEGNLEVFRFCRIPFGVVSNPFLLEATIAHHLKQSDNSLAMSILHNTYVDNVVTCVQNVAEAKKLYIESKELFAKASMNLSEWGSNSKEFFKGGREFMKPCKHCLTNRMQLLKIFVVILRV